MGRFPFLEKCLQKGSVPIRREYLLGLGKYEHMWGVGRHSRGSQVYDYWMDPWGRVHERWADSDRLNVGDGGHDLTPDQAFGSQWGEQPSETFFGHVSP